MSEIVYVRGRAMPCVEHLEGRTLFAVTPNDPLFELQWFLQKVSAPQAWDITTGSSSVVVNVNDSGIDYTHPDLYRNVWLNQDEIPFAVDNKALHDADDDGLITFWDLNATDKKGVRVNGAFVNDVNVNGYIDGGDLLSDPRWENGVDNGGNGFTDDLIGWDFVNDDNDPMDDQTHGTFCAGIMGAAGNNGEGGAGVAWRMQMMATKAVTAKGGGDDPDFIAGLHYAADNGARISNNSWGSYNMPKNRVQRFSDAIDYTRAKGVLCVFAAGNEGWDNDVDGRGQAFPASIDLPNILSVAASDENDQLASFSNYGLTSVDLAAPGQNIGSTIPTVLNPEVPYAGGDSGTSLAAPHVTGAAALLLARNPNLSYAQLKSLILDNVDPVPALAGKTVSGGRLNVFKAVAAVPAPGMEAGAESATFSAVRIGRSESLLPTASANSASAFDSLDGEEDELTVP